MTKDPLILTLELNGASFAWLDALRRQHFPTARNVLSAHLTLFHKLDQSGLDAMMAVMRTARVPILPLDFSGLRPLGGGVAIEVHSPPLLALRKRLVDAVAGDLTPQDRQGFRPHVTIQNKVTASVARDTLAMLQTNFTPRTGHGVALQAWRYLGGPWAPRERLAFG